MKPFPHVATDTDFGASVQAALDVADPAHTPIRPVVMLTASLIFSLLVIGVVALVAHLVQG